MGFISKIHSRYLKCREMKKRKLKITKNFKDLKEHRKLTREQKKEVQSFYKGLIGKEIDLHCHEYFYSRTGVFTKEYVPANFYHCELVPRANEHPLNGAYGDKNLCDILFPNENVVHTYLKNMNGYFYFDGEPVSEDEALMKCRDLGRVIIKPSRESKGSGVQIVEIKEGKIDNGKESITHLFEEYKQNFLIQECIHQHKDMAALNPSSVNTIRILSYRSGMEILIIYSVIRIGRKNQVIDNQCAGGISTAIDKCGKLSSNAFGGYSTDNISKTDTGIVLDGYQIPSYDKAIEMVKRLHMRLPFFNIIGWDVAIEEDGNPVLIEFNTNPGLSQSAFCSGMGEYTERIIRELWPRKNSWFHD